MKLLSCASDKSYSELFCFSSVAGHLRLHRVTAAEREEQRKRDKELGRLNAKAASEEEPDRSGWAKYTLGLKHQVSSAVVNWLGGV